MISRMLRTQAAPASHKLARYALASLALLTYAGSMNAQAPRQCEALKGHEPRLAQASEALSKAVGDDAVKRAPAAAEAALASAKAAYALKELVAGVTSGPTGVVYREARCRAANPVSLQTVCILWSVEHHHTQAVEKLEALKRVGPPTHVQRAADEMLSALKAASSSLPSCAEEVKKMVNEAPEPAGPAGPQVPVGSFTAPAGIGGAPPNTFDADVLGFHVKLENGSVTRSGDTKLAGTVSVWPKNNPSLKMLVNGNVYVKGGSSPNAIYGDGKVDLTSGGSSLAFTEGDFNTAPGGGSLTGVGKFQRYGHTFDASFTLSSQGSFSGQGEWRGRGKGWQSVPGVEVEYQVSSPLLKVSFSGATASATLDTDKVEVRTKARNAGGEHLARAELNPDPVTVNADGRLRLPMPTLPSPSDPDRAAREACEAAARQLKQDAGPCRGKFPPPAGLPNLPSRVEVQVNVIIE